MKNRCRILIVDDDATNREILMEIFDDRGAYLCQLAKDGEEALSIIGSFRPDIVLLDIMMPGMDGYAVARRIRANPKLKYTKIIMVSGKIKTEERLVGYESGADDYIVKPFHEEELLAKIKVFAKLKLAEEVDQIKSTIMSLSAHETKTPLNAIFMSSQLLLADNTLTANQKEAVNAIYTSAKKLNSYIDKVFRLCQVKKGVDMNMASNTVQNFIANEISLVQQEFSGQITFQCHDPAAPLHVDFNLFCEAFRAILANAVKFSPPGGEISVSSGTENGMTVITVADQGKGIEPEYLDSLFDGFTVANLMHHHQGSGLSLAISRTIIEQHGGTLTADNRPGGGAAFTMSLPMETGDPP